MTAKISLSTSANLAIAATGMLILSGCNQMPGIDLGSTGSTFGGAKAPAYQHTLSEKLKPQDAFVSLPEDSGEIIEVAQTRYGNGVEQLIIYKGDSATRGENATLVRMAVTTEGRSKTESLKLKPISSGQISAEIRDALPGVAMTVSNELHANAYGPFGYALGRTSGNVRCIYGWQQMKGNKDDRWNFFRKASERPRLSIRLRVCRSRITDSQLVNLMKNLRVTADPEQAVKQSAVSWNAGNGGNVSNILPQYTPNGYVSQEREVYEEPVVQKVRKTAPRRIAPKKVAVQEVVAVREVVEQPSFVPQPPVVTHSTPKQTTGAYSPPMPSKVEKVKPIVPAVSGAKSIVPVPADTKTTFQLPVAKIEKPVAVLRKYDPTKTVRVVEDAKPAYQKATANGFGSVPLPN